MKKYINTETLNERLRFAGKTREELAECMGCSEQTLRACMTKEDRPVYEKLNRQADIISAAFVRAKKDKLAEEIKSRCPELADKDPMVMHVDAPSVIVIAGGKPYVYNPDTGRIY